MYQLETRFARIIYSSRRNRNVVARRPTVEIWESISNIYMYTSTYFFSHPIYFVLSSPFYSLSLLVETQNRGHIAGSLSPLPTTVPAFHFYREDISALSCLVDPASIELCLRTVGALSSWSFFFNSTTFSQIHSKSRHGGIRTHGPTQVAFEGYH